MKKLTNHQNISLKQALFYAGIFPAIFIILGLFKLITGTMLTTSVSLAYFIIPFIAFIINFMILSTQKGKIFKSIFLILIFVLFLFIFFVVIGFGGYKEKKSAFDDKALKKLEELNETNFLYPTISDLGEYESLEYHKFDYYLFIFQDSTNYFICHYDADEYQIQKEKLTETYSYQNIPVCDDRGYSCEPTITLNGYNFTMLSFEESEYDMLYYPNDIFFIITNDETNEIGYMWYSSPDLDIVRSLEDLILDDAGWKYIR